MWRFGKPRKNDADPRIEGPGDRLASYATPNDQPARARQEPPAAEPPRPPHARLHPQRSIAEVDVMGDTAVATLSVTELSQEEGAEMLADLLYEMAETGAKHFVLDLTSVQYMDTACLGCLVQALNNLAAEGGRIAIAKANHSVHYVFRLTRLDRVFRICSDVMSALQAVQTEGEAA